MKPHKEIDCTNFNQKVSPEDFESGDFGTLDIGEVAEGESIDFMAKGVMTQEGLKVLQVAIMGGGSGTYDESEEEEEAPILKKLTKGDDDDDEI